MISAAILWISGMIVFLTLAIVFSKGEVFSHKEFYIVGGILFVLSIFSCRFLKYFGLPLIILIGFLIVGFSFFFLRFPLANEIDTFVFRLEEANTCSVRIMRSFNPDFPTKFETFQLADEENALTITLFEFQIDESLPFVGGQKRISPAKIIQNDVIVFSNPMISRIPFFNLFKNESQRSIIKIQEHQQSISINSLQ
jgi:hypothetical protein